MHKDEYQVEQKWLDYVYKNIDDQIKQYTKQSKEYQSQMLMIRTSLRDEYGISSASTNQMSDIAQQITELRHNATIFGIQYELLEKLQKAEKAPYFGRIDFHEEGLPALESMYIGIRSLIDQESKLPLVYDWRAPVSSMFYDYGLGKASYEGPGGIYSGEISLKRQYRIENRQINYMFESELTIDDNILQQTLGQHANEKMRTIVNTIQREQNQAIRNNKDDLLLVEGPAGSGKTSVALHRIAYLLYKYRDNISSKNIIIFSPNRIFSDYISHVLPELGEENVTQTTFQDFSEPFLGWDWDVETQLSYLENLMGKEGQLRKNHLDSLAFKSSFVFQRVLEQLVEHILNQACDFFDIKFAQQQIISAKEQQKLFDQNYNYLPVQKRLRKIKERILFLLRPIKRKQFYAILNELESEKKYENASWWSLAREAVGRIKKELDPILERLNQQLNVDSFLWYKRLWQEDALWAKVTGGLKMPAGGNESLISLDNSLISFEDVVPLVYLKGELEGYPVIRNIQHVVVDEVQDYAPIQLHILTKTFPRARFTFVGDIFQSLNPYMWQNGKNLENTFASLDPTTIRLNKSYRSTEEIFHFCNGLLSGEIQAETVLRSGSKPTIHRLKKEHYADGLHDLIMTKKKADFETVAVICESVEEGRRIFEILAKVDSSLEIFLLDHEKAKFKPGVIIVPVFLAKGLEFDAVIVPDISAVKYGQEYQRRPLYVACSRALHSLDLIYAETESLSPFVIGVPEELYSLE